ncbi:metal-dependent hydrolase [Paenibacillus sp. NFR01]|uniref:metal-dependent hydrolase n=1 Tax=Paenibacillus sp. NFR01 TaxID=1566279 RepID=UPI0008C05184|nr:metal-dependent hydrolase [Paenibacillus sp. NFR01]SET94569.1 inner membrane protein [Paenibacillus sp. NFR01]
MMGKSHLVIGTGVALSVMGLLGQEITLPVVAVAAVSSLLPDIDEPNSMLVRGALPAALIRLLQLLLVAAAGLVYWQGGLAWPWNLALALLIASTSILPGRRLRQLAMLLSAVGLMAFAEALHPWNFVAAGILILATIVPHRGLTHTFYALAGWTLLLYAAGSGMPGAGPGLLQPGGAPPQLWLAGGLAYLMHLLCDALTQRGITPLPPLEFKLRLKLMSTGTKRGGAVEKVCVLLTVLLLLYTFVLPN